MRTQRHRSWLGGAGQAASRLSQRGAHFGTGLLGAWRGFWWRLRHSRFGAVKPGWWVLMAILGVYALWATVALIGARQELARYKPAPRTAVGTVKSSSATVAGAPVAGPLVRLVWPLEGAGMPRSNANIPGAPRAYRSGVSQGFTFTGSDAGLPVRYGTPVVAAADGQIMRADREYREPSSAEYRQLLTAVRGGASEAQLDRLRGRQVWIKHADGTVTKYGHLASIAPNLGFDDVRQGQAIGTVGNSGTLQGASGSRSNARLQFEIWRGGVYLGRGLKPAQVRAAANGVVR